MTEQRLIQTIEKQNETIKKQNEIIGQHAERIDQLEREVIMLHASIQLDRKKEAVRVYVAEIAKRFGVSTKAFAGRMANLPRLSN